MLNRLVPEELQILVGTNTKGCGGTYYKVQTITPHEGYDGSKYKNDIAVVRIEGEFDFNSKVQPIAIPTEPIASDAQLKILGWGQSRTELQMIDVNLVSRARCEVVFNLDGSDDQICTLDRRGTGACQVSY